MGSLGTWTDNISSQHKYQYTEIYQIQVIYPEEFNRESLTSGNISNQSSLSGEFNRESLITGLISNTSDFTYILENLEVFIKGSISNTSIIQGKVNRQSNIAGIVYNISSFSPHILGNLKYFYGIISNISSFKPTIQDETFYLIEDGTGTEIQQLQFEPLYQGDVSSVKEIVLKAVEGYG